MVIDMDNYRRTDSEFDADADVARRRAYGNTAPALQLAEVETEANATWLDTPTLPEADDFDDFDAKEFIEQAYALATQI